MAAVSCFVLYATLVSSWSYAPRWQNAATANIFVRYFPSAQSIPHTFVPDAANRFISVSRDWEESDFMPERTSEIH